MPKRPVTPPPGNDEPKYLTVVHPYPLHAHWELQKDRQDFARWFACCVDLSAFYAFFHKPSSLNMVIVEIQKDYKGFDRLLGEHRWSEFLRSPSDEEKDKVTRVYFCHHSTGRIVQKMGWKRIDVQAAWFENWSRNNSRVTYPYPETHYCDLPPEDKTNTPLCRPLPVISFAPPKPPPPPVVGSEGWVSNRGANIQPARGAGAWKKGPSQLATRSDRAARGKPVVDVPRSEAVTIMPPVRTTGISPIHQGYGSDPSSSISGSSSPANSSYQTPALLPPGLGLQPTRAPVMNAWGLSRNVSSASSTSSQIPPALDRHANFSTASTASGSSAVFIDDFEENNSDTGGTIHVQVTGSLEDGLYKVGIKDVDYVAPWEEQKEMIDFESISDYPKHQPVVVPEPVICPAHGTICKKGICAAYSELLRAEEKRKKKEEAEKRGRKGGANSGNWRGGQGGRFEKGRSKERNNNNSNNRGGNARGVWGNSGRTDSGMPPKVWSSANPSAVDESSSAADDDDGGFAIVSAKGKNRAHSRVHSNAASDIDAESVAGSDAGNSDWGRISNGPW